MSGDSRQRMMTHDFARQYFPVKPREEVCRECGKGADAHPFRMKCAPLAVSGPALPTKPGHCGYCGQPMGAEKKCVFCPSDNPLEDEDLPASDMAMAQHLGLPR
jgi:hypothetical protein